MSTTYAGLQALVTTYLQRTDFASRIPSAISIAENRINADFTAPPTIQTGTVATTPNSRVAPLPAGCLEILRLFYTDLSVSDPLVYLTPAQMADNQVTWAQRPEYFTVTAGQIEFECLSDNAYTLSCEFTKALDIANDSTNWLSQNAEEVYLYATLAECHRMVMDEQRASYYDGKYMEALKVAKMRANRLARKNAILLPDVMRVLKRRNFTIEGGY